MNHHLLAIIGKRLPAIYDVIPHGPQSFDQRLLLSALNPQPLPPLPLAVGARIAEEFSRVVWFADQFKLNIGNVKDILDDWCPTPPRWPKFPWGPIPYPEPEPHPEWFEEFHLGFATRLSAISEQFDNRHAQEIFNAAIDRSANIFAK